MLVSEEQQQILSLQERLDDPRLRTRETSLVVAEAIRLRREQGGETTLREALAPSVQDVLQESIRRDPGILAEVLFPVMGPAIRKAIAEALRAMIDSFDKALDGSLSFRGLSWRVEALRTGRPYAEVALLRSLIYRVEQVFVFHRKTSLLLLHAVAPDVAAQDAGMVAGMLSAIQDFIRDSFRMDPADALDSLQVGELQLWVEHGPHATLAAVVRGEAGHPYRLLMKEKVEELHRRFGDQLERFDGDAGLFGQFRPDLDDCLVARYSNEVRTPRRYLLSISLVLFSLLIGWQLWGYFQMRRWRAFVDLLRHQPGIFVTSLERHNGLYQIRGLRDPLAIDPRRFAETAGLDPRRAAFHWEPFYSLDDVLVLQRASRLLLPPKTVEITVDHGTLRVAGEATAEWAGELRRRAPAIPGVVSIDARNLHNSDAAVPQKTAVEKTVILFPPGSWEPAASEDPKIMSLLPLLRGLIENAEASHVNLGIDVVGHSDNVGRKELNLHLSEARAHQVIQQLAQKGLDATYMHARGAGATEPVARGGSVSDRQKNRSVTFEVHLAGKTPQPGAAFLP